MKTTQKRNDCISKNEIEQLITSGKKVLIIDVRSKEEYLEQHVVGALNISFDDLLERLNELKRADLFVTVCGKGGGRSTKAAHLLNENGKNANWLCGGTFGWFDK